MTNFTFLLTVVVVFFTFNAQAVAKNVVLNAAMFNKVFVDKTMTIVETKPDKKAGKKRTYKAYIGDMGAVRTIHPDGASGTYGWSIKSNGIVCFKNNMRLRRRGVSCGFMVSDGTGVYKYYKEKGALKKKVKGGSEKIVGVGRSKHILTLRNFKKGNQL